VFLSIIYNYLNPKTTREISWCNYLEGALAKLDTVELISYSAYQTDFTFD
jgi:hypothetical protein